MEHSNYLKLERVKRILESEGKNPEIVLSPYMDLPELKWGHSNIVTCDEVILNGADICWFQSNGFNHLLRIIQNGKDFQWVPKSRNGDDMCMPILLEWYKNHVIFIYQEEHGVFVVSVKDKDVKDHFIHGCELARKADLLSYETFSKKLDKHFWLIELPSLKSLKPINKQLAKQVGLLPIEWSEGSNDYLRS